MRHVHRYSFLLVAFFVAAWIGSEATVPVQAAWKFGKDKDSTKDHSTHLFSFHARKPVEESMVDRFRRYVYSPLEMAKRQVASIQNTLHEQSERLEEKTNELLGREQHKETERGFLNNIRQRFHQVGDQVTEETEKLRAKTGKLATHVQEGFIRGQEQIQTKGEEFKDSAKERTKEFEGKVKGLFEDVKGKIGEGATHAKEQLEETRDRIPTAEDVKGRIKLKKEEWTGKAKSKEEDLTGRLASTSEDFTEKLRSAGEGIAGKYKSNLNDAQEAVHDRVDYAKSRAKKMISDVHGRVSEATDFESTKDNLVHTGSNMYNRWVQRVSDLGEQLTNRAREVISSDPTFKARQQQSRQLDSFLEGIWKERLPRMWEAFVEFHDEEMETFFQEFDRIHDTNATKESVDKESSIPSHSAEHSACGIDHLPKVYERIHHLERGLEKGLFRLDFLRKELDEISSTDE